MARVVSATGLARAAIDGFWAAATPPNAATDPAAFEALGIDRIETGAAMPAAAALRHAKRWSFDTPRDFDADDWWFGARFPASSLAVDERARLVFDGLGGLADVWVNGVHVGRSVNGLVAFSVDVTAALAGDNALVVRCASLGAALREKKPRPRWKTRITPRQELRFFRQTLLGRMPSWTPPCPLVGPYGAVHLERSRGLAVDAARITTTLEGDDGFVRLDLDLDTFGGAVTRAIARVGDASAELDVAGGRVTGVVRVPAPARWWPHTHGAPARHRVSALVEVGGVEHVLDLGRTGFRTIDADRSDDGFALRVNGVRVFCRGASWTPLDVVAGSSSAEAVDRAVADAARAGMNMLRLSGTMLYGDAALYDACDARGVLVWQDFPFANLDYPQADPAFEAEVKREASAFLDAVDARPSLAVLCGGSEVAQQAAMMGTPPDAWSGPLFDAWLPAASAAARPDVPFVANSPSGGAVPFQVNASVSHYYGVGAYLRPLDDARRADVRFATECLAFANVPSERALARLLDDGESAAHHPRWKARVPRDRSSGWDFDDVRDHYVRQLFGVDPMAVRYADMGRYLELGRVAVGEVLAATFAEWRRARSTCGGALVWLLRDLWPGPGFGLFDASGEPKVALRYLARALQPVSIACTDEGQNGLAVHVVNDLPAPLAAEVRLSLYRDGHVEIGGGVLAVDVPPHAAIELSAERVMGRFYDTAYAYRFGPPSFDVAALRLVDRGGATLGQAFHLPLGLSRPRVDVGLDATARPIDGGALELTVTSRAFAQAVAIDCGAFEPSDDRFHLAPGAARVVVLSPPSSGPARLAGSVTALNATSPARIAITS